jgi:HK97 family phage major capsid protein
MGNVLELREQYEAARSELMTMQSRNVDEGTIRAKLNRALALKRQLESAQDGANFNASLERLTNGMPHFGGGGRASLGAQFLSSDTWRWLQQTKNTRSGRWDSPASELGMATVWAATLTEDSASGGDLVIADTQAGILPLPQRKLVVADLLAPGTTTSNAITYMKETTFTNAAATVAEGAAKPESTLVFDAVTDVASKIATWVPASDEILEDVPQLQSYIDGRLRLAVQLVEDDQLLNGDGTAPNFSGLLDRAGIATPLARGADTNADAIAKQIKAIETAQNVEVDGIIMHPSNWLTILLAKDANGQYYGDGPFRSMQQPMLWGRPVALTTAITLGTALPGAFKVAAQFFRKGGVRVDISNSHSDFFAKNLVAIRAEERGILTVRRPAAYGLVTGLN